MTLSFGFKERTAEDGFVLISFALFLPLLCAFIFATSFVGYLIQHKTQIRSTCLLDARAIQKNLIQNQENLFRLNPLASALRVRLRLAYTELALAIAAENPIWIAEVQAKIFQIKTEQKKLDGLQQTLIQKGNLEALTQTIDLQQKLDNIGQNLGSIWNFYLHSLTAITLIKAPKMAVIRDSPDLAPIYELALDHQQQQRLVLNWQNRFKTKSSSQSFLKSENDVEWTCSVSAKKERMIWSLLINVVRS